MTTAGILAGWASANMTPPVPCWLDGYVARDSPAAGVHDPLFAHALALGTFERPLVLVVCDLISIDSTLVRNIRQSAAQRNPGATVWIGATHTHSGPDTHDSRVEAKIVTGASQAVRQAIDAMQPVAASFASGCVEGIGGNRDHPHRSTRLSLDLLRLSSAATPGDPALALLGSFGCHPTVLGADNLCVSADLAGAFRRALCSRTQDLVWVALATGAAGDISTRHFRRNQTFEELKRLGLLLAERAVRILDNWHPVRLSAPIIEQRVLQLQPKPSTQLAARESARDTLERERTALLQSGDVEEARTREVALQALMLPSVRDQLIEAEVSVARLGDLALVAVPGELYSRLGQTITDHTEQTLVFGYTNGYVGYIPTRDAFADALDYEVLASQVAPGEGERLAAVASQLLDATCGG